MSYGYDEKSAGVSVPGPMVSHQGEQWDTETREPEEKRPRMGVVVQRAGGWGV